jgi:hypothetical protein
MVQEPQKASVSSRRRFLLGATGLAGCRCRCCCGEASPRQQCLRLWTSRRPCLWIPPSAPHGGRPGGHDAELYADHGRA